MSAQSILVTGGNGLLASEIKAIAPHGTVFCDKDEMDITSLNSIRSFIEDKKFYCIINCAAGRDAEYLESHEDEAYDISVNGPANLAVVANELGATLIHISTDYVFDGKKSSPYVETDATNGLSVYGRVKAQGEQAALSTADTAIVIRTAWLFSSYGKDFVKTIKNLAETRSEIGVVWDQVGTATYAGDLAKVILEIAPEIKPQTKEIYHFSNEGVCSWYDLAYNIVKAFGLQNKCQVKPLLTHEYPMKAPRPTYSVLDKSKIKKDFGIKIRHYSEALSDCVAKIRG